MRHAIALGLAAAASIGLCQGPATSDVNAATVARQEIAGANRFSLDLYKRTALSSGNLFFSPANVSAAMGLAYRGAKGATATELRGVFHFTASPRDYLTAEAALREPRDLSGSGRELHAAAALWVQQDLPLEPDFISDMTRPGPSGIRRVDFKLDPAAARDRINRWVSSATNDRISALLRPGDVDAGTRLTLVSSLYWKGRWARSFSKSATATEPFIGIDGGTVPTPLMHQKAGFATAEHDGVKAIQLPYIGGEVAMVMLMPDKPSDFTRFERSLTPETLDRWTDELDHAYGRDTELVMPRMHVEWRGDLVPTLKSLGAQTAFGSRADFTGITSGRIAGDPSANLRIGGVIHQSWLDVDETGSEAAAATAVMMIGSAMRRPAPQPFVFRADKPFLFLLRDRRTGLILFIGRYVAAPHI